MPRGRRISAADLETLVENRPLVFLRSWIDLHTAIEPFVADGRGQADLITAAADLAERWPGIKASDKRSILLSLIARIGLFDASVKIRIRPNHWSRS